MQQSLSRGDEAITAERLKPTLTDKGTPFSVKSVACRFDAPSSADFGLL
ncbi:hypothetical protein [Nitrococcus mobilis]|uniref:Uncharacterized protein n=1 Tax=Nitrococcus mobilis Nb-231 TaxID=314278 RepID=A4BL80_9GAMM|nr:hypothetical protein [Nitrococcus mobilis]EAR23068.1 hypothetical protein NB231_14648 [Nitrococcus mobilis Nb-231]